jgi:Uncharacterised nucleotidyltransferase
MASTLHLPCEQPQVSPVANGGDALSLLARLCARTGEPDGDASRIRALAEGRPDWSALLGAAAGHSVTPLVCKRLLELGGDGLPASWRDRFRQELVTNARRNLLLTAELIRVLRVFEGGGLQTMPFKGPVLAQQAYDDLSLRQFADLDVVLPHSQIAEAHRALESLDYSSESAAAAMAEGRIPGQYAYRNHARNTLIELHTERTMRYLPVPLDWKAFGSRLQTLSVGGQPLRTFSVEDTMMLLSVHGTKHFWTRLGWICDIAELVQAPRGIDWPRAEKLARQMRCHRMWLLGLALANELLAAPLPKDVAGQIRNEAHIVALARRVQGQYLLSGESGIGAADRAGFRMNTQDNFVTGLRQLSIFATRPTDEDWQSSPLPRWATPFYALLRPMRILRRG